MEETFTISEDNLIKKGSTPQNACKTTTTTTNWNFKPHKARASSGETFTISEENCIQKELWTVLKHII